MRLQLTNFRQIAQASFKFMLKRSGLLSCKMKNYNYNKINENQKRKTIKFVQYISLIDELLLQKVLWTKSSLIIKFEQSNSQDVLVEINNINRNFDFWPRFFSQNISIWLTFYFLIKILMFDQISIFEQHFYFSSKLSICDQNVNVCQTLFDQISIFWSKFQFLTESSIFDRNSKLWGPCLEIIIANNSRHCRHLWRSILWPI